MNKPFLSLLILWVPFAFAEPPPMPPRFTPDKDAEELLRDYPLGVITELAAYSHHGHPDHKITLPNGLEGWVYEIYGDREIRTYVQPGGSETEVEETPGASPKWSFVLVFSADGTVIDVLYDGKHPRLGLSALQVQRRIEPAAQKLPGVDHGKHFAPGSSQDRY
ncbi:MAG: hypothetical protein U9Q81_02115 [Pseudomonadota bacterium]|nr:hypothetical protein [Pseudomonadota bacterium]